MKYLDPNYCPFCEAETAEALLREVISTYYMTDRDEPGWVPGTLGARIAAHLGLKLKP